jgi:putative transposase
MRLAEGRVMSDTAKVPRKSAGDPAGRRPLVGEELADQLLGKAQAGGVELPGPDGLLSQVTKAVLERALAGEMTGHLGYGKHDLAGRGSGSNRNGTAGKTVLTDIGAVDLAVPRDRNGTFGPRIVRKGQTRLEGFNERIIALYARGMTTRDIRAHLREMYGVEVSADLISRVTDGVLEELAEWQSRPLDRIYPVIFTGALMVKIRDGVVTNRAVYVAIGVDCDGARQVLGLWAGPTTGEPAKFWLSVLSELKGRGVADVCIVCCDGLTGLPEAISVTWPQAIVQLWVVHRSRQESTCWLCVAVAPIALSLSTNVRRSAAEEYWCFSGMMVTRWASRIGRTSLIAFHRVLRLMLNSSARVSRVQTRRW